MTIIHFWHKHPLTPRWAHACGLDAEGGSDDYSETPIEVTCERCLAALRTLSGAASPGREGAPSSAPSPTPEFAPSTPAPVPDSDAVAVLKSYSRLAVLAERERCAKIAEGYLIRVEEVRGQRDGNEYPFGTSIAAKIRKGEE